MIYDELLVQDGRYGLYISAAGSWDTWVGGGSGGYDRSRITYQGSGAEPVTATLSAMIDGERKPLSSLPIIESYEVDFYPLLSEAGIVGAEYVTWLNATLATTLATRAKDAARADRRSPSIGSVLPSPRYLGVKAHESLYADALLADRLALPFAIDHRAASLAEWKNAQITEALGHDPTGAFHAVWLSLGCPDSADATWDEVLYARESTCS